MQLIVKEGMNALNDIDLEKNRQISSNINQVYTTTSLCDINATINTPCIYKYLKIFFFCKNKLFY